MLLHVCHFHHHHQHHPTFWQFIDYRDTRAFILDPCIQEFFEKTRLKELRSLTTRMEMMQNDLQIDI